MNANTKKAAIVLAAAVLMGAAAAGALLGQPQNRARLRDNINTLRLLRMTQALELTEGQTAKLFPVLTRIDREKSELQNRMSAAIRELRAALDRTPVREADVLTLVQRVRGLRESVRQKDAEFDAALDENLTPVQKGRYLIFLVDFARGLGEKLNQARQARLDR
ncbi:MAG TPA: periplasmic heavy metal sensor [Terriglobales bacterium]|nr:periplasmic heavy metal sensor [Terriglobales bacterium]